MSTNFFHKIFYKFAGKINDYFNSSILKIAFILSKNRLLEIAKILQNIKQGQDEILCMVVFVLFSY
jgi:hypothetical protein